MRVVFLWLIVAASGWAQEPAGANRYDVLARAILPLVQTFSPDHAQHALRLDGRLLRMTKQPDALKSAHVALATEYADKLRLEVTVNGELYTLARDGQRVWIAPGARAQALISAIPKLPKRHADFVLPPLQLPFDLKQLALLPILFQVADAGEVKDAAGQSTRVLDVTVMPELARGLKVEDWTARLWIRPDGTPAQLKLTHEGWQIIIALDKVQTGASFPPETWQPAAAQKADVLELSAPEVKQLLDAAGKQIRKSAQPKSSEAEPAKD